MANLRHKMQAIATDYHAIHIISCLYALSHYYTLDVVAVAPFLPLLIILGKRAAYPAASTDGDDSGGFSPAVRGGFTRRAHVAHRAWPGHRQVSGRPAGRRGDAQPGWAALD